MHIALRHKQQVHSASVRHDHGCYQVTTADGVVHEVEVAEIEDDVVRLTVGGRSYRVAIARNGRERFIGIDGGVYSFVPESATHSTHSVGNFAAPEVVAPMPGKILQVLVNAGDRVEAGDGLVILEAMKMETRLSAEAAGTVTEVRVSPGDTVDGGQVLVVMQFDS